jgi:RimJ/RimL family protein N-acetyltransferase
MPLPIETERLVIRRFELSDADDIVELVSAPSVARVTTEIKANVTDVNDYIKLQRSLEPFEPDVCFDLGIELKQKSKIIGLVSLIRKDHRQGMVGWALNEGYRRRGYATEAGRALVSHGFEHLDLHRIYAITSNVNIPSWKVLERLGMRREGHYKEAEYLDGQWLDVLVYAVLADEWRANIP